MLMSPVRPLSVLLILVNIMHRSGLNRLTLISMTSLKRSLPSQSNASQSGKGDSINQMKILARNATNKKQKGSSVRWRLADLRKQQEINIRATRAY